MPSSTFSEYKLWLRLNNAVWTTENHVTYSSQQLLYSDVHENLLPVVTVGSATQNLVLLNMTCLKNLTNNLKLIN